MRVRSRALPVHRQSNKKPDQQSLTGPSLEELLNPRMRKNEYKYDFRLLEWAAYSNNLFIPPWFAY
jgi:hypothetical protein